MNKMGWKKGILLFFVISRIILWMLGVDFVVNYDFMYFHSIEEIQNNFWESLIYTHAFNPSMNILAGVALILPEGIQPMFYRIIFSLFSLLLIFSMGKILEIFRFRDHIILGILCFFSITPAYIYFESFLIYTMPSAALLIAVCFALYNGLKYNTLKSWTTFFALCAILSFVRSSFHLIWLLSILIGIIMIDFKNIKSKLLGFALPFSLIFVWNFKNFLLFGFFGASSWGGFNLHFTTTAGLSLQEKDNLVEQGLMSPLVKIPIYSGVEAYYDYIEPNEKTGISILDEVNKNPRVPNYNNINFISLSTLKMKDNWAFIRRYPLRYLKTVAIGIIDFHNPSTRWHPHDETRSPHMPVRKVIGKWENLYNWVLHFPGTRGMGFYLLFLPIVLFNMIRLSIQHIRGKTLSNEQKLLTFINWNIFYLMIVSCLITYGELERYRFISESLIWVSVLTFVASNNNFLFRKLIKEK